MSKFKIGDLVRLQGSDEPVLQAEVIGINNHLCQVRYLSDGLIGTIPCTELEYIPEIKEEESYGPVTFPQTIPVESLTKLNKIIKPEGETIVRADRYNEGKAPVTMVDPLFIQKTAEVLAFGARKYDRNNWRKGFKYNDVCDSLLRHLYSFLAGEDIDPESGLSHISHAACNLMFLTRYIEDGNTDLDDRYKETEND